MPLPIGPWKLNQNGVLTELNINEVELNGNMVGTLNNAPVFGYWDEIAQRLAFTSAGPVTFTGFLSSDQNRMPGIEGGTVFTLVGVYSVSGFATGATADRNAFGWYAQIGAA